MVWLASGQWYNTSQLNDCLVMLFPAFALLANQTPLVSDDVWNQSVCSIIQAPIPLNDTTGILINMQIQIDMNVFDREDEGIRNHFQQLNFGKLRA